MVVSGLREALACIARRDSRLFGGELTEANFVAGFVFGLQQIGKLLRASAAGMGFERAFPQCTSEAFTGLRQR